MLKYQQVQVFVILIILSLTDKSCGISTGNGEERETLSLLLIPYPAPTHMMGLSILGKELIRRGHNVTFCVAHIKARYVNVGRKLCKETGMSLMATLPHSEVRSESQKFQSFKKLRIMNCLI